MPRAVRRRRLRKRWNGVDKRPDRQGVAAMDIASFDLGKAAGLVLGPAGAAI